MDVSRTILLLIGVGSFVSLIALVWARRQMRDKKLSARRISTGSPAHSAETMDLWLGALYVSIPQASRSAVQQKAYEAARNQDRPEQILAIWKEHGAQVVLHKQADTVQTLGEACDWLRSVSARDWRDPNTPTVQRGHTLFSLHYATQYPPSPTKLRHLGDVAGQLCSEHCVGVVFLRVKPRLLPFNIFDPIVLDVLQWAFSTAMFVSLILAVWLGLGSSGKENGALPEQAIPTPTVSSQAPSHPHPPPACSPAPVVPAPPAPPPEDREGGSSGGSGGAASAGTPSAVPPGSGSAQQPKSPSGAVSGTPSPSGSPNLRATLPTTHSTTNPGTRAPMKDQQK